MKSIAMAKQPAVYILTSKRNGTLYTGVTSNLIRRIWEHRNGHDEGFTKRYGVRRLVYFEAHEDMREAIVREKRIKKWNRAWKIELIEKSNPEWRDLWSTITGGEDMDPRLRGDDIEAQSSSPEPSSPPVRSSMKPVTTQAESGNPHNPPIRRPRESGGLRNPPTRRPHESGNPPTPPTRHPRESGGPPTRAS